MSRTETLSLAAEHRPTTLREVVGQGHVVSVLKAALARGAVPQQILFCGGSGLGKTTLARVLGASLLCSASPESRDEYMTPCGHCRSCAALSTRGTHHPDLVELDAASHGGKDEIREIAARSQLAPMMSDFRVYIIDEAHGLTGPGAQAFLKLLEEPPPHVFFMLCTTDPDKMLKTTRSRCVEFSLTAPTTADMVKNLERICSAQGLDFSPEVLEAVVETSDPDLGVRGTAMCLSRLVPLSGDAQAALLALGQPRPALVREFVSSCVSGDKQQTWARMRFMLEEFPAPALRSAILRHVRALVDESLKSGQDPASLVHLYDSIAQASPTVEGLEIVSLRAPQVAAEMPANSADSGTLPKGRTGAGAPAASTAPAQDPVERLRSSLPSSSAKELLGSLDVTLQDASLHIAVPDALEAEFRAHTKDFSAAARSLGMTLRVARQSAQ